jgi:hypothetical protein
MEITLLRTDHIVILAKYLSQGVTMAFLSSWYVSVSMSTLSSDLRGQEKRGYLEHTSKSGFTQYKSANSATRIRPRKNTVKTWMMASRMEISRVVRRTWKPAATRGVTCSKAALIWREYGIPILRGGGVAGVSDN